jgi:phosphoribosylamine--glycine ligase
MMFGGGFGEAGAEVVIEEFMVGEEASFFALCDGEHAIPLASAQDHKRAFDGDKGPNTGGMGAYSPAPVMTPMCARVMDEIIMPTLRAMKAMGTPFKGVLYAGADDHAQGPKLIEYNVRFGDPECQVLMLRLMSDIVPALIACADGS